MNTNIPAVPATPSAIICLKIYMGFCSLLGLLWLTIGSLQILGIMEPHLGLFETALVSGDEAMRNELIEEKKEDSRFMLIAGALTFLTYGCAVFLPRTPRAQYHANILLGLSLLACITLPFVVLLFVFVNKWPGNTYFKNP